MLNSRQYGREDRSPNMGGRDKRGISFSHSSMDSHSNLSGNDMGMDGEPLSARRASDLGNS